MQRTLYHLPLQAYSSPGKPIKAMGFLFRYLQSRGAVRAPKPRAHAPQGLRKDLTSQEPESQQCPTVCLWILAISATTGGSDWLSVICSRLAQTLHHNFPFQFSETGFYSVVQVNLQFTATLLPQLPKCCDCRHKHCAVSISVLNELRFLGLLSEPAAGAAFLQPSSHTRAEDLQTRHWHPLSRARKHPCS